MTQLRHKFPIIHHGLPISHPKLSFPVGDLDPNHSPTNGQHYTTQQTVGRPISAGKQRGKLKGKVARHARHPRSILVRMSRVPGVSARMSRGNCSRGISAVPRRQHARRAAMFVRKFNYIRSMRLTRVSPKFYRLSGHCVVVYLRLTLAGRLRCSAKRCFICVKSTTYFNVILYVGCAILFTRIMYVASDNERATTPRVCVHKLIPL